MFKIRRLLPGHPFKVAMYDDCPNFLTYFRRTWKQIPLSWRRAIIKHWRSRGHLDDFILVEAGAYWSRGEGALATAGILGFSMKFKPVVDTMPEAAACFLIAHELAHVFQFAVGKVREFAKIANGDEDAWREMVEEDADEIAACWWGFDSLALYTWKCSNKKEAA